MTFGIPNTVLSPNITPKNNSAPSEEKTTWAEETEKGNADKCDQLKKKKVTPEQKGNYQGKWNCYKSQTKNWKNYER